MACATCARCHHSANSTNCPRCGGAMISDEDFSTFTHRDRPKRPSFFDPEVERKRRLELAIVGIEEFMRRKICLPARQ